MPVISYGMKSDIGHVREDNQDASGVFPSDAQDQETAEVLFVVADGMGGHRGGREASAIAVRTLNNSFFSSREEDIPERLRNAIESANSAVRDRGAGDPELRGMGTTITVLVFAGEHGFVAHVGDSRAYRVVGSEMEQLTDDHSIVAEWQRKGWITEEQARTHPERSLLYRALGVSDEVSVDVSEILNIREGDLFLLCTDGLTNHVGDSEIKEILSAHAPQDACDQLVTLALERGGFDNVTVQAIRIGKRN